LDRSGAEHPDERNSKMRTPFTIAEFLDVFRQYNTAVWPAQWILALLAVVIVALAMRGRPRDHRWVSGILAVLWGWMALAYQLAFFTTLSRVGVLFAGAFVVQGLMLAWLALRTHPVVYRPGSDAAGLIGAALIVYALAVYPALGYALGHRYPAAPTFGVPCPTTIFTLGLFVWSRGTIPWGLLIVPIVWAVVGVSAAFNLGMREDLGLVVAAIIALVSFVVARRRGLKTRAGYLAPQT
jgi:hypothetical protein